MARGAKPGRKAQEKAPEKPTILREAETPPETLAIFGSNLRRARESIGITQHDLARRAGVSLSSISYIESGRQNVTLLLAMSLASAVGRPLFTLLIPPNSDGGFAAPDPGTLAIELPPGDAFVVALSAAERLGKRLDLVDPVSRAVIQHVTPPPKR